MQLSIWRLINLCVMAIICCHGLINPPVGWDLVAYVGSAHSLMSADKVEVHRQAYADVKAGLDPALYNTLIQDYSTPERPSNYRSTMLVNPEAFHQQLPYYKVRPLYIGAIALSSILGMNPVTFIFCISYFSALVIGILLFEWLRRITSFGKAIVLSVCTMGISTIPQFSGVATPDTLAAALLVGWAYQLWFNTSRLGLVLTAFVLLLTRSDTLVYVLPSLWISIWCRNHLNLRQTITLFPIALTLGLLAVYVLVAKWAGHYGWWMLFYFTFIQSIHFPADTPIPFQINLYFGEMIRQFRWAIAENNWWWLGLLWILSAMRACLPLKKFIKSSIDVKIFTGITLTIFTIVLHFLVFPALWDRFFIAHYVIIILLFLTMLVPSFLNPSSYSKN